MRFSILPWALAVLVASQTGAVAGSGPTRVFNTTDAFPLPNQGHLRAHDPNIIRHNGFYFLFKGGIHLPFYRATGLSGPWEQVGHVFDKDSVIKKVHRDRPWSPTTIERNGTFYCYYVISSSGSRNSAIGIATTDTLDGRPWKDHGAIINTGEGYLSHVFPYNITNAIDPSIIRDRQTGETFLNYGSFWHDIWQVPLAPNLLSVEDESKPDAVQLTFIPHHGQYRPEEGSWMSFHNGYYYLWFSHGKCCHFQNGFPAAGKEYSIRVGRSKHVRGPFVDHEGKLLLDGGGTIVYASNHGVVYAPGGIGVLSGNSTARGSASYDVLYYHYLNTSIGFENKEAYLGWNFLKYLNEWPVVVEGHNDTESKLPADNETRNKTTKDGNGRGNKTEGAATLAYSLPGWIYTACLISVSLQHGL